MRVAPNGDIFVAETRAGTNSGAARGRRRAQSRRPTRSMPAGLISRSASPSFRAATIRNGSTSPTPTASSAFPTSPAISRPPEAPRPWSPSCRTATAIRRGTSPSPPTTNGCWCRSARPATTPKAWRRPPGGLPAWIDEHPLGASWGSETDRADVLAFDPDGKNPGIFATGIRNCVGLAVHPDDRRSLLLDQRARRPRRQSGAGLRHAGARRRASTAGPGITSAATRIRAMPASVPI